jgi:hypothetical protein
MAVTRTYVYRLLKSAWGIRVSITATAKVGETPAGTQISPESKIWLALDALERKLTQPETEQLCNGLLIVSSEISEKVQSQPVSIALSDVSYVESDFQLEGLASAILRWAEEEFQLPHHEIGESFDRASNRYVFEWS